ncbi:MAG: hypothetical protein HY791_12895 [Deltaproteobacteria bacterium]|nr:hypothetical protein [Deltaproteobacteria bacterium]
MKAEIETVRDLVRTARATAEERENVPGSAALLRGIRADAPPGGEHYVYFLSGSPESLRKTIERKLQLDGVSPDGVVLKPQLSNLVRGRFRAVRNQIAYKLGALLHGRAQAPVRSAETLFGDDAESDAFIYALYADLVAGRVPEAELEKVLQRAGAYPDQVQHIRKLLESIVHERAVERIVIHLDQLTPPAEFSDFFPLAVPIYNHLQTALVLWLDGRVSARTVAEVTRELVAYESIEGPKPRTEEERLSAKPEARRIRLLNSAEDILRRRRLEIELCRLDELASGLRREVRGNGQADAADATIEGIAERAEHVRTRPLPRSTEPPFPESSWLERLEREELRQSKIREKKKSKKSSKPQEPALEEGPA